MDESNSNKMCLICSTPNAGVHFGIDACRACANFFKRAHLAARHIPCRQGTKMCSVNKAIGSMCRGCRFDKCVAIGMRYDGPMRTNKPKCQPNDIPVPMTATASSTPVRDSLLDRIVREQELSNARARMHELALAKRFQLERLPHPTEEVYLASYNFALAAFNENIPESWLFFISVFPTIQDFSYDDQREFFRSCAMAFGTFDCFYRTKKIWGGFSKYSMCSLITCIDTQNPDGWIGEGDGGPVRKEVLESIGTYINNQMKLVVPSFEKADICEREKHALLALFVCESDLQSDFVERFQPFLDEIRAQIFDDLHRFYTDEMGLSDYSTRVGNLLTICHTFREANVAFQDFFRMQVTIFDLHITETLFKDLVL